MGMSMRRFLSAGLMVLWCACSAAPAAAPEPAPEPRAGGLVYVIPIREDVMSPLAYVVRRGVKEAMEAKADLLVLDMETNGGRVDVTEEIIEILGRFKGTTATYVNRKAFSAGAFIAVGTQKIYMAPQSVIGAATPVMVIPGGGVEKMPESYESKMTSAIRALVRTSAEKNGHNVDVVEAMIDRSKALTMDGEVLNEKGEILTLTNLEAEKTYGNPPKPLLSLGTMESVEALIGELGHAGSKVVHVTPTGAEQVAFFLNMISPLLLLVGFLGIYIEFKTPGFGVPGIVGLAAFGLYFLGGYVAGLAGMEWVALFVLGLGLVVLELFVLPGTMLLGIGGVFLVLASLVMAAIDWYPGTPKMPNFSQVQAPLADIFIALGLLAVIIALFGKKFLQTSFARRLTSSAPSGDLAVAELEASLQTRLGLVGVAVSRLRPGGKARFGEELLDVVSIAGMVESGARVRIVSHSGADPVVEPVAEGPSA